MSTFLHKSTEVYWLPAVGVDAEVDRLIERGELIVTGETTDRKGHLVRLARSKGMTYYNPARKPA